MRFVFLFLLLCCLPGYTSFSEAAPPADNAYLTQAQAVGLIKQLRGDIKYAQTGSNREIKSIFFSNSEIDDARLASLKEFDTLQDLAFYGSKVTGVGLEHLKGFNKLHTLHLVRCPLVDEGLMHLKQFPALKHVYIRNADLTDAAVEH
ncbi:MAG: hypothetical protein ABIK07_12235, partial [Planctomycetota bacterium]